jgi:spore coat protein U-like protein
VNLIWRAVRIAARHINFWAPEKGKSLRNRLHKFCVICLLVTGLICPAQAYAASSTSGVNVSATIVSKGRCTFTTTSANPATLDFGILNPLNPLDVAVDTGTQLSFSCNGNGRDPITYLAAITASENGTAASPRMSNPGGTFFLPYKLSLNPVSGNAEKKVIITLAVTGTVLGIDYQSLPPGDYRDSVTVSITP